MSEFLRNSELPLLRCIFKSQGINGQDKFIAEIYFRCGTVNMSRGNYLKAILDFSNASKNDDSSSKYVSHLAKCYQEIDNIEEALIFYKEAIDHCAPESLEIAKIKLQRGILHYKKDDYEVT